MDYFDRAAARNPDRIAVTDGTMSYTFSALAALSIKIANAIVANKIGPGEAIAILSPNHPHVLACQHAIMRAGCVWVPTNSRNAVTNTLDQTKQFEVKWIFYHTSLQADVDIIVAGAPGLRGVIPIDGPSPSGETLEAWFSAAPSDVTLPDVKMDDVLFLGATGGTSGGGLKGAVHTNQSWELTILNSYGLLKMNKPVVHLVMAPLSHGAGTMHWLVIARGATLVICPSSDPATILNMIEEYRVTFMFLPPTILYTLLSYSGLADHDVSSLEQVVIGSAPVSVEKLKEAVEVFGPVICHAYGQTEALINNMFMSSDDLAAAACDPALEHRLASTGREGPGVRIEIMDDEGNILPAGERGEIVMKTGTMMREYYKDPERTANSRLFGWHHTGDIGWRDEQGYLYIVDRKNDMIISGGFNIYPGEIEQVVLAHPAIQDCAVVGAPHEKWGEIILAVIELKPGQIFDESSFLSYCKKRLGGFRAPKMVEVVDKLPRSPVGKTLRRAVRDRHWAGHARQI